MVKNKRNQNVKMLKKGTKGITLIVLAITIIVLLILAGVSIATLTGENGILKQTNESKEEARGASVEEERDLWEINQEADKQTKQSLEELLNDLENQKLITAEERTTIEETGEVTIGSRTIVFKTIEILAKDVLKTDSTATDEASKSPYVKYNGLDCRVLYNDKTHGLQLITSESIEIVTLGYGDDTVTASDFTYDGTATTVDDDFKKAAASYNNVVDNLNNKAKTYMDNKGIATDARCLGSIPTLTSGSKFQGDTTTEMWSGDYTYLTTYSWNNKFKKDDKNFSEDVSQLNNLGLNVSSGNTWLGSRDAYSYPTDTKFLVRFVRTNGDSGSYGLCEVRNNGPTYRNSPEFGFRPVFLLSSDVVISEGDGSFGSPYVIK